MDKDFQKYKDNKKSFKRYLASFKYAFNGVRYAFYHEKNLIIMFIIAILVFVLGIVLNISYVERLIIVLIIGLLMALELINTAIENVTNLASMKQDENAKLAKDCASGAVAIIVIFAIIVGLMIFIPRIMELLQK